MEPLLQLFLFPKRLRFRWRNRKRLTVTESLKATLKARCEEAIRADIPTYQGIYNVGLFVVLVEQDISAYSEAIFFARSEWHRQFYARGLAVLLYEAAEDLPQLLGKQYRTWLQDLELGSEWTNLLNHAGSKLSAFNRSHGQFLKELRNYVSAHRDHDALSQIDTMAKFKAIDLYRLGAEFSVPLNDLLAFYTHLLRYMHNPAVMLHHVAKSVAP
ncbi:MAG: hypothetical protein EG825_14665 [Rhodocyclaceae bacterium]|nr:hypothetical protein [Rhodocyclaceae bacterium]